MIQINEYKNEKSQYLEEEYNNGFYGKTPISSPRMKPTLKTFTDGEEKYQNFQLVTPSMSPRSSTSSMVTKMTPITNKINSPS